MKVRTPYRPLALFAWQRDNAARPRRGNDAAQASRSPTAKAGSRLGARGATGGKPTVAKLRRPLRAPRGAQRPPVQFRSALSIVSDDRPKAVVSVARGSHADRPAIPKHREPKTGVQSNSADRGWPELTLMCLGGGCCRGAARASIPDDRRKGASAVFTRAWQTIVEPPIRPRVNGRKTGEE
jgi:hypothetical protein